MDNQEKLSQEEIYQQEEKCIKAIRTVRKALFMRLFVAGLMVWIVLQNPAQVWAWGLGAFVLLIDLSGAVPLWMELRKQKKKLNDLIELEEE